MITFAQARRIVENDVPGGAETATVGYESDGRWWPIVLPARLGGRVPGVSKDSGVLTWVSSLDREYAASRPWGRLDARPNPYTHLPGRHNQEDHGRERKARRPGNSSSRIRSIAATIAELDNRAQSPRETVMRITDKQTKRALTDKDRDDKERAEAELESLAREGKQLAEEQLALLSERDGPPWGGYQDLGSLGEAFTVPKSSANRSKVDAARQEYVRDDKKTIRLNRSVRSGNPSAEASAWRMRMDEMTSSETVGADTVVYRGAALTPETVSQLRTGSVFADPGIVSTDIDPSLAESYGQARAGRIPGTLNTVFSIRVPKGTEGFDAGYGEFVFGAGHQFRVIGSRRRGDGLIEVAAEMVGEGGEG